MLKTYNTLEEVPEALRSEYKKSDGRYVPDLSEDHPVLVHNKTLLGEKATATARVKELEADIATASEKSIPRGHVAVPKADADLLAKYKENGTLEEVAAIKTEHATLKDKDMKRTREESLRQVSKALSLNDEAFTRLPNLPDFISKPGSDGKTVEWFAQVKDDKGVITEKPAKEFIESSTDIAPFMAALKTSNQQQSPQLPGSSMTVTPPSNDPFAWAKQFSENYVKESQPVADPFKAFSERSSI